eukprot:3039050-Pleurochrysis_carterae.AAC.1
MYSARSSLHARRMRLRRYSKDCATLYARALVRALAAHATLLHATLREKQRQRDRDRNRDRASERARGGEIAHALAAH